VRPAFIRLIASVATKLEQILSDTFVLSNDLVSGLRAKLSDRASSSAHAHQEDLRAAADTEQFSRPIVRDKRKDTI